MFFQRFLSERIHRKSFWLEIPCHCIIKDSNEEVKKNDLSLFRFEPFMYLKNFNRINRKTNDISKQSMEEIMFFNQ